MMRRLPLLGFLLAASAAVFAQPTVSNPATVSKSHSTVVIKIDTSEVAAYTRVRFGLTTSYEGAGSFPDSGIQHYNVYDLNTSRAVIMRVSGLKPNTTYHFCPQVSLNNSAWSECVDHVETTEEVPAGDHPAYPIPPAPVDTAMPDTTGYTARNVASDCSDLQTHINAAAADQPNAGSIITIPAGTTCTGVYDLKAPSRLTFSPSDVNTATNRITITGHGLNDNDQVWLATAGGPGSAGFMAFAGQRGNFPNGNVFYARVIDANTISLASTSGGSALPFTSSTFTVNAGTDVFSVANERNAPYDGYNVEFVSTGTLPAPLEPNTTYYTRDRSARTFKVSATNGGAAIDITDTGSGTHSIADRGAGGYLLKWPLTTNKIIVRTSTPDSQLVPPGVRITPEFASKMAKIQPGNQAEAAINHVDLAHNYRFIGIEFTHPDTASAEISSTINPKHWLGLIYIRRAARNIIFDRCYIHGLGFPNRLLRAIVSFDGGDSAIINSHWSKLDYWTPVREGLALTRTDNTHFTIATGTFHIGPGSASVASTVTITLSGSASGTATGRVYFSMAGALTLNLPTGVSASCSPSVCTTTNNASPTYPVNGDGGTTVMPLGNLSFTDAALTAVSAEELIPSNHQRTWEGASSFIAGEVAGRTAIINNTVEAAGLPIHYDDSVGNQGPTGTDYTVTRNLFRVPREYIFSLEGSDKLRYGQRQFLEWKAGKRIRVRGNIFEGPHVDVTPIATALAISATPGPGGAITDVEVGYNIFRHGSGTMSILGGRVKTANADTHPPPAPLQRAWIHNNLAYDINQYKYRAYTVNNSGSTITDHRFAIEDLRYEHNTMHDVRGTIGSAFTLAGVPMEGARFADNILWINGAATLSFDECTLNTPVCSGDGRALLNTFGWNTVWKNNTAIAGWTNESGTTPRSSKTYITSAWPDAGETDAYLQAEMTGEIDWLSAAGGDFRLGPAASHKSGGAKRATDGLDRGANIDQLSREVGTIRLSDVLGITSSAATIPFVAPDRGASCIVAYGTGSNRGSWTGRSSADTSDSYARSISLSGLSAGSEMQYSVWCAGTAQSAIGVFRTAP